MQKHTRPLLDKKPAKYYLLRYTIAMLYTLAVVYLLLFKVPSTEKLGFLSFPHSDKIIHFFIFGILSTIWVLSPFGKKSNYSKKIILIGILSFLFSLKLEILQSFTDYRTFDNYDIMANLSGILIFYLIQKKSKIFQKIYFRLQ